MNVTYNAEEMQRIGEARNSFSGNLLTDRQFDDAMAITGVVERRIKETGTFKECLNDFSNAYARTERFDAMRADSTIRDLFRIRTGVTMNQMRESLMEREAKLFDRKNNPAENELRCAYQAANQAAHKVEEGNKMKFDRAFAYEAAVLATELDITDAGAKKLMRESFQETENRELYDWGKELDDTYYRPQIEMEKRQRREEKSYSRSPEPSMS